MFVLFFSIGGKLNFKNGFVDPTCEMVRSAVE